MELQPKPTEPPKPSDNVQPGLNEPSIRFLIAVIQNKGLPSSKYADLAKLGKQQAVNIRKRLVKGGYLKEHKVPKKSRGRDPILLEPTDSAYEAVTKTGGSK